MEQRSSDQIFRETRDAYAGLDVTLSERIRANLDLARKIPHMSWYYVDVARMQFSMMRGNRARLLDMIATYGLDETLDQQTRIALRDRSIVPFDVTPLLAALADDPDPISYFPPKVVDRSKFKPEATTPATIVVMSDYVQIRERTPAEIEEDRRIAEQIAGRPFDQLKQSTLF